MSDKTNSVLMTQAQYGRDRNKSPQYIGKLAKAGVLVMRGRMVDAVAPDAVLDDNRLREPHPKDSSRRTTPRRNWPTWCSAPNCAAWNSRPAKAS